MYGINMRTVLSTQFSFYGLAQVTALPGGSRTHLAFECLTHSLQADPPAPSLASYALFISDEGSVYPPTLQAHHIPFGQLLIIKAKDPDSVWKTSLEAMQTGLFSFVIMRPSRPCPAHYLRNLQLCAERKQVKVLILCDERLPHWTLKATLVQQN